MATAFTSPPVTAIIYSSYMPADYYDRVIGAWLAGESDQSGNLYTDGHGLWWARHLIGHTDEAGQRVLYDCHALVSIRKAVNMAKPSVSTVVNPCLSCEMMIWRL